MESTPIARLTLATFQELLNTRFVIRADARQSVELTLAEATEIRPSHPPSNDQEPPQYESFSLTFTGPPESFLPQKTYPFEHERLGRFELFIVPAGQTESGVDYHAVLNLRR